MEDTYEYQTMGDTNRRDWAKSGLPGDPQHDPGAVRPFVPRQPAALGTVHRCHDHRSGEARQQFMPALLEPRMRVQPAPRERCSRRPPRARLHHEGGVLRPTDHAHHGDPVPGFGAGGLRRGVAVQSLRGSGCRDGAPRGALRLPEADVQPLREQLRGQLQHNVPRVEGRAETPRWLRR